MTSPLTNITKISVGIFIASFLVQLAVCNHMAVKTQELNSVSVQIVDLQNQISAVNQEIYLASSIVGMEQKAKEQGFVLGASVKSITTPTIARAF